MILPDSGWEIGEEYLRGRARVSGRGELDGASRLSDASSVWLDSVRAQGKATSTVNAYADALRLHVVPGLGALRLREVSVSVVDRFLRTVQERTGPAAAKHARTVLNGVLGMAVRYEAIEANPVRDATSIRVESKVAGR